ncbi:MAG: single-stranded-DNA-specific exonuclease RecJ [Dehalococcoidales bacterium]|nr:single-stranded-DNA-specific exonuclease RecJ [Dehalococcoidales bacterium]
MGHSRWNLLPPVPDGHAIQSCGYTPIVTQLLFNRGLTETSQLEAFIASDERLATDPFLLPDMPAAVARLYRALLSGEKIAIYGDFDTDGITATALLVQGLAMLNCQAVPYIPHRLNEGYGVKTSALEMLSQQGISLVITVDCGITAVAEVKRAHKLGMDVIITDHHTPQSEVPSAAAVVDPKLPGSRASSDLAGVGVALKLLQALFQSMGKAEQADNLLDFVALGTVADMMPLLGENRYLVSRGLKIINASPRLGIREIMLNSGSTTASLDAEAISWIIAPRLNAAGRLSHAMNSYRLLMTDSSKEARELAVWLEQTNAERQTLTTKAQAVARSRVLSRELTPLLFVSDPDFPTGICGLVAGRLANEFYRPAVVVKTGDQFSGGSCRSIPEFDIFHALSRHRHLFSNFGGHAQAAGFSLPTRDLPQLENALKQLAAEQLEGVDLRSRIDVDIEVKLSELGGDMFPSIQKLAPFGQGNPQPVFLSRGIEVLSCRAMGDTGSHLRVKLKQDGSVWDAVAFDLGDCIREVVTPLDVVFHIEIDRWNGSQLRLNILDFAPSGRE